MHHRVEIYLINCSVIPCPRGKIILAPSERLEIIYHILILPPSHRRAENELSIWNSCFVKHLSVSYYPPD